MTNLNGRDLEQLSAFLDGELDQAGRARLNARLARDPGLRAALEDLRQTRLLLRRTPQRRAPRNFTLTPRMAGLRPPTPRLVPVFSWASAAALLLFVCTLGTGLLPRFAFGAAAPAATAAPVQAFSVNNTQAESATAAAPQLAAPTMPPPQPTTLPTFEALATASQGYGLGGGPNPLDQTQPAANATPELMTKSLQAETLQPGTVEPPAAGLRTTVRQPAPAINPWPYIWLGLAVLLGGAALLTRWLYTRAFRHRIEGGRKP